MRNVLVLGFVGFGFLLGCMNNNYDQASARETAERIGKFRYLCENEQGIQDETPEMTACITKMNQQTPRNVVAQRQNTADSSHYHGRDVTPCTTPPWATQV